MNSNHPIVYNLITKAVLPFVVTLLLFGVFSCKKQLDVDRFSGIYNGEGCSSSFVFDTINGGGEFVTACEPNFVEVIVESEKDDELRIVFNGVRDVKVEPDLSFYDGDSLYGTFYDDSVYVLYYINEHNTKSFRGKKQ